MRLNIRKRPPCNVCSCCRYYNHSLRHHVCGAGEQPLRMRSARRPAPPARAPSPHHPQTPLSPRGYRHIICHMPTPHSPDRHLDIWAVAAQNPAQIDTGAGWPPNSQMTRPEQAQIRPEFHLGGTRPEFPKFWAACILGAMSAQNFENSGRSPPR